MRMIARFHKTGAARYVSQLDLLRAVQRAIRRSGLPVKYSSGFNPHQIIAFASASSVGLASEAEWMDVALTDDVDEGAFMAALAPQMPPGLTLIECHAVDDRYPALMNLTAFADYRISLPLLRAVDDTDAAKRVQDLLASPLLAVKKSKAGPKEVDLRDWIASIAVASGTPDSIELALRLVHASSGALNPDLLIPHLSQAFPSDPARVPVAVRTAFWAANGDDLVPLWCAVRGAV